MGHVPPSSLVATVSNSFLISVSGLRRPSSVSDRREALAWEARLVVANGSGGRGGAGDGVMRRVITSPHAHLVTGALCRLDAVVGDVGGLQPLKGGREVTHTDARTLRMPRESGRGRATEHAGYLAWKTVLPLGPVPWVTGYDVPEPRAASM